MQLPPADELVLVSGLPPIRARKARYFEDPRLTERVLAPPLMASGQSGAAPSDDWSQLPFSAVAPAGRDVDASGNGRIGDPANAGIRREPELPEHEEIALGSASPTPEFVFGEEDPDDDADRARVLSQQVRGLARQAAMDPNDGIDL